MFRHPERFSAFQAVRLLEWAARRAEADPRLRAPRPVGESHDPTEEVVRLGAAVWPAFAPAEIAEAHAKGLWEDHPGPPGLRVTYMGLTGPSGVLPPLVGDAVVDTVKARSRSLRDFLDLFDHRLLSLFHRAWKKYRLPAQYEQAAGPERGAAPDPVTAVLAALIGQGTPGLAGRLAFDDEALIHYCGPLARRQRPAVMVEALLSDMLGRPVRVEQFAARWMALAIEDQTRLASAAEPLGQYCALGLDAVVGDRVRDVQGAFRLRIGPLSLQRFTAFLPGAPEAARLADMTRRVVGPDLDFDVQLTLRADQVPPLRLGGAADCPPRLGWTTWLGDSPPGADRDDAVFRYADGGRPPPAFGPAPGEAG
nr:type VI secretion system baseplate subunit TssG [Roseospira visakhapatnamensis]